jgi:hypothetical protein
VPLRVPAIKKSAYCCNNLICPDESLIAAFSKLCGRVSLPKSLWSLTFPNSEFSQVCDTFAHLRDPATVERQRVSPIDAALSFSARPTEIVASWRLSLESYDYGDLPGYPRRLGAVSAEDTGVLLRAGPRFTSSMRVDDTAGSCRF